MRGMRGLSGLLLLLVMAGLAATVSSASPGSTTGSGSSSIVDMKIRFVVEKLLHVKQSVKGDYRKVDQVFWPELGITMESSLQQILKKSSASRKRALADPTTTEVEVRGTITPDLISQINSVGSVTFSSTKFGSLLAVIPLTYIKVLANHTGVTAIRAPDQFRTLKTVVSQGVAAHRVNQAAQLYPQFNGTGVKIGVLSDSVDNLGLVQGLGDLPAVTVLPGQAGSGTGEGTAMLEIVNDMAPGAQLYFATAGDSQDVFAENILALANQGCKVIVDDIIFFAEPAFEDGTVAKAVDQVASQGVLYFSSAGNEGNKYLQSSGTYEGNYNPGPWINFTDPGFTPVYMDAHVFAGSQTSNRLTGNPTVVTLHWADPFFSPEADYDLFVFDDSGNLLSFSIGYSVAFEAVQISDTFSGGMNVVVPRFDGPARFISLRSYDGVFQVNTNGSIFGHAASANAFAVAAIQHRDGGAFIDAPVSSLIPEVFTSDGPRKIFFEQGAAVTPGNFLASGGKIRLKPELTAADGTASATPGFSPFFGTSAAAPHAAAIAAIAFSAKPSLTQAQFRQILARTAIDILQPGFDIVSGFGVIDAVSVLRYTAGCLPNPCKNNGTCVLSSNSVACSCVAPYFGPDCSDTGGAVDPCSSSPCLNKGNCTSSGNDAICSCPTGFLGQFCQYSVPLPCASNPCLNGGVCNLDGNTVSCDCGRSGYRGSLCQIRAYCGQTLDQNAYWEPVLSLTSKARGTCLPGFVGSPYRSCGANGKFGTVVNPCQQLYCPNQTYSNAFWQAAPAGSYGTGVCSDGYVGFPFRQCLATGSWSEIVGYPCQAARCNTLTVGGTVYPAVDGNKFSTGVCQTGNGVTKAFCDSKGNWAYVTGSC